MGLKVLLDFDGVLFDSAFEVYCVCQNLLKDFEEYRKNVSYEEFLNFRKCVTDAWQFSKLYSLSYQSNSVNYCWEGERGQIESLFAERFFNSRKELMTSNDWVNYMRPFPIFYSLRKLMLTKPEVFTIISTRNKESILRTLNHFGVNEISIFGQDDVMKFESKLNLALEKKLFSNKDLVIYIDDMAEHLIPFRDYIDLCMHADWGYGVPSEQNYSQKQVISIVRGFFKCSLNGAKD